MTDIVSEQSALFLGSRLKRLAERMQAQALKIVEDAGLPLQPSQMPLLGTLDRDGPQTIAGLTAAMQIAQPSVTRAVARLAELGLVETNREHRDQRHKTIRLTPQGHAALERAKVMVWRRTEAAVNEVLIALETPLLAQLDALEALLAQEPLDVRARRLGQPAVSIEDFSDALAPAFKTINMEWIGDMYAVEPADLAVLDDPKGAVIDGGGAILFAVVEGLGPVGTVALKRTGANSVELIKMGVLKAARGLRIGEALLEAAIARAAAMGADPLYLLSNRKSVAAVRLYEKLGFVHDAGIMAQHGAEFERCDVAMLYRPAPPKA